MKCSLTALFSRPYASVNSRTASPYLRVLNPSISFSHTVSVSEHFIEASRAKLQEMMERRLDKLRLCALMIDATPFAGQQMVAALGIAQDGHKMILGLRQGATENTTVVSELLGDLVTRGLDFTAPRLYVLDGGKALSAA